ncbi:hypothetical protein [Marinoscillum sp.]|uniref:hypothetical protein n=1 Tax=Marinoscillum sp. TaxID=2024838 RepID=UPI003BADA259
MTISIETSITSFVSPRGLQTGLILGLTMASCTTIQQEGERYETALLKDGSISHSDYLANVNCNALHASVIGEFGLVENEISENGVHMIFSEIGDSYIPHIREVSIEPANRMFVSEDERLAAEAGLVRGSKEYLCDMLNKPSEDRVSALYHGISYTLARMDHTAQHRKLIVYSDLLETVSINMLSYQDAPQRMVDEYDDLRDKLLAVDSLSRDYAGLEIVFIVPGKDGFIYKVSQFWSRFFGEFGISVDVRAEY